MTTGCETDAVVTGVGGAEGELARVGTFGIDDAVVVVEDFVHGDCYGHIWVGDVGVLLGIVLEGGVVAWVAGGGRD